MVRHRRIQVGRLVVVLGVANAWIDPSGELGVLVPLVIALIAVVGVWIWLLEREGVLRQRTTLMDVAKKVGILLLLLLILDVLRTAHS